VGTVQTRSSDSWVGVDSGSPAAAAPWSPLSKNPKGRPSGLPFPRLLGGIALVDRLRALRGPSESYSDVILRLVEIEAKGEAKRPWPPRPRHPSAGPQHAPRSLFRCVRKRPYWLRRRRGRRRPTTAALRLLISSLEFASTPRPADKNDPRHDDQGGEPTHPWTTRVSFPKVSLSTRRSPELTAEPSPLWSRAPQRTGLATSPTRRAYLG
jgi:hypothetical protein